MNWLAQLKHDSRPLFSDLDGPEDNFAVVDLETAIELEIPYEWSTR